MADAALKKTAIIAAMVGFMLTLLGIYAGCRTYTVLSCESEYSKVNMQIAQRAKLAILHEMNTPTSDSFEFDLNW